MTKRIVHKAVAYCTICVATLFLLYPLLHEFGHAIMSYICGIPVQNIEIYPAFATAVELPVGKDWVYFVIAISGWLLPLLISAVKPISMAETSFILPLRIMVMVTSAAEVIDGTRSLKGHIEPMSDTVNVLQNTDLSSWIVLSAMTIVFLLAMYLTVRAFAAMVEHMAEFPMDTKKVVKGNVAENHNDN